MAHLHIPDGVLPPWLWLSGAIVATILILLAARRMSKPPYGRKLPLLSMTAAFVIVAMSIPIIPGYDIQLAAVAGIILGPAAAIIAAFVINLLLALIGHGGITVVGLNTLILSAEMVAGWGFFRLVSRVLSPALAGGISAFVAMVMSAALMIGVVALGASAVGEVPIENVVVIGAPHHHQANQAAHAGDIRNLSLRRFAAMVLVLGAVGWPIESFVSGVVIRFAARVKPDLVGLAPTYEPV
jgi:cobalt/nickel transport system permease protein